ncbi:MAG: hypothetical protein WBM28_12420 [Burkholderiales bacterium]
MNGDRGRDETAVPNGSLLRLGEEREIAIYQRDGVAWVADFRGGCAELFTAGEWFALNGRGSALRRMGLDSIVPLPARLIERIERLHGAEGRVPLAVLLARLRDRLARFSRELSCRAPAGALSPRMQRS